jgi:hypothetical protein
MHDSSIRHPMTTFTAPLDTVPPCAAETPVPVATGERWRARFESLRHGARVLVDRVRAKCLFHDVRAYRRTLGALAGESGWSRSVSDLARSVRGFDRQGLGVWRLGRGAERPQLRQLAQLALTARGPGPPRAIAQLLLRAWNDEPVCWLRESAAFHERTAAALLLVAAIQVSRIAELEPDRAPSDWSEPVERLTSAANLLRAIGQAQTSTQRADSGAGVPDLRGLVAAAESHANQAAAAARRGLNRTHLAVADDQLALEAARQTLDAAAACCLAAQHAGLAAEGPAPDGSKFSPVLQTLRQEILQWRAALLHRERLDEVRAGAMAGRMRWVARTTLRTIGADVRAAGFEFERECPAEAESHALIHRAAEQLTEELAASAVLRNAHGTTIAPTQETGVMSPESWADFVATRLDTMPSANCLCEWLVDLYQARPNQALASCALACTGALPATVQRQLWLVIADSRTTPGLRWLVFQVLCRAESRGTQAART